MANLTWNSGADLTVTADVAINSDPFKTLGSIGFSLECLVTGTGANGISGNLLLEVTNDPAGLTGWTTLDGSEYAIDLSSGQAVQYEWSFFAFFVWVRLKWVQAGMPDSGTLGAGAWNSTAASVNPPVPTPTLPTVLLPNQGTVVAAVDRLAQYLKGVPPVAPATVSNVRAIIQIIANRFAEAGQAIQGIQTARTWAALASGNCTDLLDQIGKLVGAFRPPGSSDAQYVSYVKATIAADHSSGGIEDIYAIARLMLPSAIKLRVDEYPPASFVLTLTDPIGLLGANGAAWTDPYPLPAGADGAGYAAPFGSQNTGSHVVDALATLLRRARPGGVWGAVSYSLRLDSSIFELDSAEGLDTGYWRGWAMVA